MEIVATSFGPAVPSLSPRLLPAGAASVAVNLDPSRGSLWPMRGLSALQVELPTGAFHSVVPVRSRSSGQFAWFARGSATDAVIRSPLVNDTRDRVYRFRAGALPEVATFEGAVLGEWAPLSVARPEAAPVVHVTGGSGDPLLRESRAYVYTAVTDWGEESAPSPPTVVDVGLSDVVTVSGLQLPSAVGRDVAMLRLYRTLVSNTGVVYRAVADIPAASGPFVDTVSELELSRRPLLEFSYDEPVAGLCGVRLHPSGSLVGFTGQQVRFSVPYMPHAWPDDFVITVPDRIMALEVWQQYVYVATDSSVSVIYGDVPPDFGLITFPFPLPCAFPGGMVLTTGGPVLAAVDGLYQISASGVVPLSAAAVPSARWRAEVAPIACVFEHRGRVGVLSEDGTGLLVGDGNVIWLNLGVRNPQVFRDPYDGRTLLYASGRLYELDAWLGPPLRATWRSPVYTTGTDIAFEAARVLASPGGEEVRFKLWAGPTLVVDRPVASSDPFNLPPHRPSRLWTFEIQTDAEVHEVRIVSSRAALGAGR